jgi:outer membrane protein assembly factor BamB
MNSSITRSIIPPALLAESGGVVYAGSNGVYAFDAATGSPRWSAMTDTARVAVAAAWIISSHIGPTEPEGA